VCELLVETCSALLLHMYLVALFGQAYWSFRKLDFEMYHVTSVLWWYVQPSWWNTGLWWNRQTDRQMSSHDMYHAVRVYCFVV